jgi:hypothetical protein
MKRKQTKEQIERRKHCATTLRAFQVITKQSQVAMSKELGTSRSIISDLMNSHENVAMPTLGRVEAKCEECKLARLDNARERIRNYIDDRSAAGENYTNLDFAHGVGLPVFKIVDFLSDNEERMYRFDFLEVHACARYTGIEYTKLISPLTAADYTVTA